VLLAALTPMGCVTKGPTGPDDNAPPPPPTSFQGWTGPAKFTDSTNGSTYVGTTTWEGNVTWQKGDDPDPTLPVLEGGVRYRLGPTRMHIAYRGTRTFIYPDETYTCTDVGDADVDLRSVDRSDESGLPSHLDVRPDGHYAGLIWQRANVTITRTCQTGYAGSFSGDIRMALFIVGDLRDGRRMQGEITDTGFESQEVSNWDFTGR
jgi:hypothetical protein